jgi:nitrate reductase NapE
VPAGAGTQAARVSHDWTGRAKSVSFVSWFLFDASSSSPIELRNQPGEYVMNSDDVPATRAEELRTFLFLSFVLAPVLAIAIVGGYGFFVWMYQLFTGTLPTG